MQTHTHELVSDWLYCLERRDFSALADLYSRHAVLEQGMHIVQGNTAIAQAFAKHAFDLRSVVVAGHRILNQPAAGVIFDASLQGRFGQLDLRHDLQLRDGLIRHHRVQVLRYAPANGIRRGWDEDPDDE